LLPVYLLIKKAGGFHLFNLFAKMFRSSSVNLSYIHSLKKKGKWLK
jgi:hypothetical protein